MRDTALLQLALSLAPPWTVSRSDFDPRGAVSHCSACSRRGARPGPAPCVPGFPTASSGVTAREELISPYARPTTMIEPCPAIGTLKSGERMRHVPAKGPLACATMIRNARCLPSRLRTTSWWSERKCLPSQLGSDDIRIDTNHSRWRLSTSDPEQNAQAASTAGSCSGSRSCWRGSIPVCGGSRCSRASIRPTAGRSGVTRPPGATLDGGPDWCARAPSPARNNRDAGG
jgi:hypothetical protein